MLDSAPTADLPTDEDLGALQWTTVEYYLKETNPANGLVRDKTEPNAPASIAAIGMALATYPVAVEREVLPRELLAKLALKKLRFFRDSHQGPEPDATGHKGFYYHFLDMETGRRVWQCELSTIDSSSEAFSSIPAKAALTCCSYRASSSAIRSAPCCQLASFLL